MAGLKPPALDCQPCANSRAATEKALRPFLSTPNRGMMERPVQVHRARWDSDMSKRADPNSGRKTTGNAPKPVRQMTVYDRLEDARKRRKLLLAKGEGPAPRPVPSLKASNETLPPPIRQNAPASQTIIKPDLVPVVDIEVPPRPIATPIVHPTPAQEPKSRHGRYWIRLFQAMVAIALIAVLFAIFGSRSELPEAPATAATALAPEPVIGDPVTSQAPIEIAKPTAVTLAVQSIDPEVPTTPKPGSLDVIIAPLSNPTLVARIAALQPQRPDGPPIAFDAFPPFERLSPPVILGTTPPARQIAQITEIAVEQPTPSLLGDTKNVVLLVPSFVPQSEAESAIKIAAALGIPVDQTRRASVSISRTNIRYFHEEDAAAATLLAEGLGGLARDFTAFTPSPSLGVIEIWIEGRGGNATANEGSATARGIEADLQELRNSIRRALNIVAGN